MTRVRTEVVNTDLSPNTRAISELATSILDDGGVQLCNVTIIFSGDEMLHDLKKQFFHSHDKII